MERTLLSQLESSDPEQHVRALVTLTNRAVQRMSHYTSCSFPCVIGILCVVVFVSFLIEIYVSSLLFSSPLLLPGFVSTLRFSVS